MGHLSVSGFFGGLLQLLFGLSSGFEFSTTIGPIHSTTIGPIHSTVIGPVG
jgi:hypothetical protein